MQMSSSSEQRIVDVIREQMQHREQHLRHNMEDGFKGVLHPALTIAVLPSGGYATVHQSLSLLHNLCDPHAAAASYSAPPAPRFLVTPVVEVLVQCFAAAEKFEHAVQLKKEIGQTLRELLTITTRPVTTTPTKPTHEALDDPDHPISFLCGLPMDAWQHVASFLPVDDLVHLPQVGHLFYAHRSYIVWCNLYVRCFGKYTPAQLSIVAPWDFIDDGERDGNGRWSSSSDGAFQPDGDWDDTAGICRGADDGGGEIVVSNYDIDYRSVLHNALLPLLLTSKKIFMLQPSPEPFFDSIAPRGAVTLGYHRFLLVNASPLHLITLRRACGTVRSMEVVTEEMMTTQGPIRLITLGVAVGRYAPHVDVVHSSLALTPSVRRAVTALFAEQAASDLYG